MLTNQAGWSQLNGKKSPGRASHQWFPLRRRVDGRGKSTTLNTYEEEEEKESVSGMERQLAIDKVRAGQTGLNTKGDTDNKDNASELQIPEQSADSWQEAGGSSPFCCHFVEEGGENV